MQKENLADVNLVFDVENNDFDMTSVKKKIIRLSSRGFCIGLIADEKSCQYMLPFDTFKTANNLTLLSLEDKLDAVTAVNKAMGQCEDNSFSIYTQFNVQIPEEFYSQEDNKAILPLLVENPQNYTSLAEYIDAWKLYNVSALENELYLGLTKKFPNYKLTTVLSSLLKIVSEQKSGKNVLIFVEDHNFTIIATDRHKLLGVNTFMFATEGDFIYYTHSFLRKMYINPNSISLKLCGNIAPQSPVYNVLNKYYTDIEMLSSSRDTSGNYSYYCDLF